MLDSSEPIPRRALHDKTADRLRTLIIEGALPPGAKIAERELCERFQVSRTPLREALKVLASDGLIVLTPNRGAHVSPLTIASVSDAFPMMGTLEGLAGELACARIDDVEVERIAALHDAMVARHDANDISSYFQLNQQIHDAIIAAAKNPTLASPHADLGRRINRARFAANKSSTRWAKAIEEHAEMVVALRTRDGPRLSRVCREHLANKFETIREWLEARDE